MGNVTLTCLRVLIDEKCDEIDDAFKRTVGQFIKNVIMPSYLPFLQEFESKMSQEEKEQLAKYLI